MGDPVQNVLPIFRFVDNQLSLRTHSLTQLRYRLCQACKELKLFQC